MFRAGNWRVCIGLGNSFNNLTFNDISAAQVKFQLTYQLSGNFTYQLKTAISQSTVSKTVIQTLS